VYGDNNFRIDNIKKTFKLKVYGKQYPNYTVRDKYRKLYCIYCDDLAEALLGIWMSPLGKLR